MASTTFVSGTIVESAWLNDVNDHVYNSDDDLTNAKNYGVVGDGITDDTANTILAVAGAAAAGVGLHFPAGRYRLTAPIIIPNNVSITGVGQGGQIHDPTGCTEFYFDHTGIGFYASGSACRYFNFRTLRNQPDDYPGFVPTANDWDINTVNAATDLYFENITLFNPTKGIKIAPGSGRIYFTRISGHPMTEGINIEAAYDIISLKGIHFWPFWSTGPNIQEWTIRNCIGLNFQRVDDPVVDDFFHIWAYKAINIGQYAGSGPSLPAGSTSLLRLSNAQFDIGQYGYYVDAAAVAHTAKWSNVLFQGCQSAQSTIAVTGGTTFSSFTTAGGSTYTVVLVGNAIVPTVGTHIYLNNTSGTAPDAWYKILSVTNANVFVVEGHSAGLTMATAGLTFPQKFARGFTVAGTGTNIQGTNVHFAGYEKGCIAVGTGNYVGLSDTEFLSFNTDGVSTDAAVDLDGTGELRLTGAAILNPLAGPIFVPGSGGTFRSPYWLAWTPVFTAQTGTLTSYTINQAIYMNDQYTVKYMVDVTITNIGTGSASIHFTLPTGLEPGYIKSVGSGREIVSSGHALTATATTASLSVDVVKYDNTFPAVNGSRLVITGEYAL